MGPACDLPIKRRVLYPLSYWGGSPSLPPGPLSIVESFPCL